MAGPLCCPKLTYHGRAQLKVAENNEAMRRSAFWRIPPNPHRESRIKGCSYVVYEICTGTDNLDLDAGD